MQKEKKMTPIRSDFQVSVIGIHLIPEFMQFALWFATPRQFREPKTQKKFAESVGICEDTLTDWKKHPQFWPIVYQAMNAWMKERIPDVIDSLYEKAWDKGNSKDVLAFLQLAGVDISNNQDKK